MSKSKTKNDVLSIKYDKKIGKANEFKSRIMERIVVKILALLENKRP